MVRGMGMWLAANLLAVTSLAAGQETASELDPPRAEGVVPEPQQVATPPGVELATFTTPPEPALVMPRPYAQYRLAVDEHPRAGREAAPPPAEPASIEGRRPRLARMILELLGGVGGGTVGALAGIGIGAGIGCGGDHVDSPRCYAGAAIGGLSGYAIGAPTGVYLTGNARDGNGGYGWTLFASLVGWGAAFGIASAADRPGPGMLLGFVTLPVLGSIAGYELSSDRSATEAERAERARRARVAPVAGPIRGGAFAGAAGRF